MYCGNYFSVKLGPDYIRLHNWDKALSRIVQKDIRGNNKSCSRKYPVAYGCLFETFFTVLEHFSTFSLRTRGQLVQSKSSTSSNNNKNKDKTVLIWSIFTMLERKNSLICSNDQLGRTKSILPYYLCILLHHEELCFPILPYVCY